MRSQSCCGHDDEKNPRLPLRIEPRPIVTSTTHPIDAAEHSLHKCSWDSKIMTLFSTAAKVQRLYHIVNVKRGHPRRILLRRRVLWCQCRTVGLPARRGCGDTIGTMMFCGCWRDCALFVVWMDPTTDISPIHLPSPLFYSCQPLTTKFTCFVCQPSPPWTYNSSLFAVSASLFMPHSVRICV